VFVNHYAPNDWHTLNIGESRFHMSISYMNKLTGQWLTPAEEAANFHLYVNTWKYTVSATSSVGKMEWKQVPTIRCRDHPKYFEYGWN